MGIIAISTGSILVRLAEAPALSVATWRMVLASVLLAPLAAPRLRAEAPQLSRNAWLWVVLAGLALAAHLATWIASLSMTTVASSVILVSTNPLFVGLASWIVFRESLGRRMWLAVALALAGTVTISSGDLVFAGKALLGDGLALIGAMMASAYLLLGHRVRQRLSTLAYVWPCYAVAAVALLALATISGQQLLGLGWRTYAILAALAIGPQILGHSAFNWALGRFSPVFVTLAILAEPVGATILAYMVLGEVPRWTTLVGGVSILAAIAIASRQERRADP